MALSEEVQLSIAAALAQLEKLDRSLAKALKASVTLDTVKARAEIDRLYAKATATFRKSIKLDVSTVDAGRKLTRLETQVKAIRRLAEKRIEINFGTTAAAKANERAITNLTGAQEVYSKSAFQARRLADVFTGSLERQALVAKGLAADLKVVAAAQRAFNAAGANATSGRSLLSDKQLFNVNKSLAKFKKDFADALNPDISVPNSKLVTINRNLNKLFDKKPPSPLASLGRETEGLNRQLIAAGRSMSILFTLPTIVAAGFAAFNEFRFQETIQRTKVLTDAFVNFNAVGGRVALTSDEVAARMSGLRDVFNDIATQTGQTPQDVAEGFYFVASAGGAAATRLSILRIAAQGAAVGLGTVEVVADTLTSVLNAYGESEITAAAAGDVLVRAVNDAKIEASEFAPQLGRVLPIAAELGVSFGQVAESLALLTQNGNSAQVASTQLRGILQTLIRPTSEKAAAILAKVGLSAGQLREQIKAGGPTGLIDTLRSVRSQLSIEEFSQLFRRVDALNGALTLLNKPARQTSDRFRDIAKTAAEAGTELAEFERFAQDNAALKLRQAFSALLIQLQPLGQKVLPLVVDGLGALVGTVDQLGELLTTPIMGPLTKGLIGVLVVTGPLIFALGKIRQAFQAIGKIQTVLGAERGLRRFLSGEGFGSIAASAETATSKVGFFGKAVGALPGLVGVAAAGALAFFTGSAIASDNMTTKLLGIAGSLGAVVLAFGAAKSAALAFGATAGLATGIGAVGALLVAGVAAFSAYREATSRTRKALEEFQTSLEGLTANEGIRKFGLTLFDEFSKFTVDDRITQIELPELKEALKGAGLTAQELGEKLANIVLASPNDLEAQRRGLKALADEMAGFTSGDRLGATVQALQTLNDVAKETGESDLKGFGGGGFRITLQRLQSVGDISDEARDSILQLADAGLISFSDLGLAIRDPIAAAQLLGATLSGETLAVLDKLTEAFRRQRQSALDTVGVFGLVDNAAGAFFETVDDEGGTVTEFVSDIDAAVDSLDSLTTALDDAVEAVFGLRDQTFLGEATDQLVENAKKRAKDLLGIKNEFLLTDKGEQQQPNAEFINFQVDLLGPDGVDARQFIRNEIDKIDDIIQPFLTGPDADIEVGLNLRDWFTTGLANDIGRSVEELNAFLEQDQGGLTTIQLRTALTEQGTAEALLELRQFQALIESAPLTKKVKIEIEEDTTGSLFGSKLLEAGLTDAKSVVDFVINATATGVPLETLQGIFGAAIEGGGVGGLEIVRNFIIQGIEEGVPLSEIAAAITAIPDPIRRQLIIETFDPNKSTGSDLAIFGKGGLLDRDAETGVQFKINAIIAEAGKIEFDNLVKEVETGEEFPVTPVVTTSEEYNRFVEEVARQHSYPVRVNVFIDQALSQIAIVRAHLRNLQAFGLTAFGNASGRQGADIHAGGIFGGSGFRRFRQGGMALPGFGLPREPMIARAPSNTRGILWGEPETHGEAYIPYNPARRKRAEALVTRVAKDFGMEVSKRQRVAMSRVGATMPTSTTAGGSDSREVARLAGEVATLAKVIESREVQPLIGEYHAETRTTNPRATARFLATDLIKALR